MDGFFTRQEVLGDRANPVRALLRAFKKARWNEQGQKVVCYETCKFCGGKGQTEPTGQRCEPCNGTGQVPIYEEKSE
jgi:RecJ-like exonuclease